MLYRARKIGNATQFCVLFIVAFICQSANAELENGIGYRFIANEPEGKRYIGFLRGDTSNSQNVFFDTVISGRKP